MYSYETNPYASLLISLTYRGMKHANDNVLPTAALPRVCRTTTTAAFRQLVTGRECRVMSQLRAARRLKDVRRDDGREFGMVVGNLGRW